MLLISACHLVMFYICAKFHEIILNGIKGIILQKMQLEQPLLISACRLVMLYIYAKFHEIISNGIKDIEWTRFL